MTVTSFNKSTEEYKGLIVYEGLNSIRMQDLSTDRRVPMNFYQVMQQRLEVLSKATANKVRDAWWNNYVDTGDGARRHPNGSLKIAYDSSTLRSLTPTSALQRGALLLTPDEYTAGDGPTFTLDEVTQYTGKRHASVDAVVANPIWRALARDDETLLREYAQTFVTKYGNAMAVWPPGVQQQPVERLWFAGSLDGSFWRVAGGDYNLDGFGRLVGVAQQARARAGNPAR
jgi:hypothetical protein